MIPVILSIVMTFVCIVGVFTALICASKYKSQENGFQFLAFVLGIAAAWCGYFALLSMSMSVSNSNTNKTNATVVTQPS